MAGVAIGMVVSDRADPVRTTLASLSAYTQRDFDLTLLGDGANPETLAEFKAHPQSNTEQARGNAACFNRLVNRSSAGYYLLLEAGTQVSPGWLDHLLAAAEQFPNCGLAGPSTNRADNAQCIFPAAANTPEEVSRIAKVCARRFGRSCRSLEPLHSLSDFCYLVRREVIEAIGRAEESCGFGPTWVMDYNLRAARAGFVGLWACGAYVHRGPAVERPTREEIRSATQDGQVLQEKFCSLPSVDLKHSIRDFRQGSACLITAPANPLEVHVPLDRDPVRERNRPAMTESLPSSSPVEASGGDEALPSGFKDFRGFHKGATVVVCGCGASLKTFVNPGRCITIGVNDVGRLFHPDYLVVVNPRHQFQSDRFRHVEESKARAIFTQLDLGLQHKRVVRFNLGRRAGVDFSNPDVLNYTSNSPYVALCLAVHMGARKIGIIGVDFTNDHFFAQTGTHPLERQLPQIDREYRQLYDECVRRGVEVFNLSTQSRLTAFPKLSLQEFAGTSTESLKTVSSPTIPVAATQ